MRLAAQRPACPVYGITFSFARSCFESRFQTRNICLEVLFHAKLLQPVYAFPAMIPLPISVIRCVKRIERALPAEKVEVLLVLVEFLESGPEHLL